MSSHLCLNQHCTSEARKRGIGQTHTKIQIQNYFKDLMAIYQKIALPKFPLYYVLLQLVSRIRFPIPTNWWLSICVCTNVLFQFLTAFLNIQLPQQFRQRIVGFEHRMHTKLHDGTFHYGSHKEGGEFQGYSIMGTGTAILHRVYLEMFFDKEVLPKGMIEYIDRIKNCEDIGMNVMVTNFLATVSWPQSSALSAVPHGSVQNMEAQTRKSVHLHMMTACELLHELHLSGGLFAAAD